MRFAKLSLLALIKASILFFLLLGVSNAQPPIGTAVIRQSPNGTIRYYSKSGRWLGNSTANRFGGQTYYDGRGLYSQTMSSGIGIRQTYSRQNPNFGKLHLQSTPKSHTIVSPPGSSIGIRKGKL